MKVGKDGDVVLWSDNPLSIYAKPIYTIVDGTIYFDRAKEEQMQASIEAERNRIIRKMNAEKRAGNPVQPAMPSYQIVHTCMEHDSHDLLIIESDDTDNN